MNYFLNKKKKLDSQFGDYFIPFNQIFLQIIGDQKSFKVVFIYS